MAKNVSPPSYADVLKESLPTAPAAENKNQQTTKSDLYPNITQEDFASSPEQDPNDQRMPSKPTSENQDQQKIKSDSNTNLAQEEDTSLSSENEDQQASESDSTSHKSKEDVSRSPSPDEEPIEVTFENPHIASKRPITVICPHCQEKTRTETIKTGGLMTLVFTIILCFVSCPLACLPYFCDCCDCCKDVEHKCPKCGNYVGIHKPYHRSNFC